MILNNRGLRGSKALFRKVLFEVAAWLTQDSGVAETKKTPAGQAFLGF
jgi:hypothetical protein